MSKFRLRNPKKFRFQNTKKFRNQNMFSFRQVIGCEQREQYGERTQKTTVKHT